MFEYNAIINNETQLRLNSHGLVLNMEVETSVAEFGRNSNDISHIVGIDSPMPNKVRCAEGVHKWVELLCLNEYNCKEQDIVWDVVDCEPTNTGEIYSIGSKDDGWLFSTGHIVFIKKSAWLKHVKENEFKEHMVADMHNAMRNEVVRYSAFINNEIYNIELTTDSCRIAGQNEFLWNETIIYNQDRLIDGIVNDMIDQSLGLLADQLSTIAVTLTPIASLFDDNSAAMVIDEIRGNFGFAPFIGEAVIGNDGKDITFDMWVDSIPNVLSLISILSNKGSNLNILKEITGRVSQDNTDFLVNIGEIKHYEDWHIDYVIALIHILFGWSDEFVIVETSNISNAKYQLDAFKSRFFNLESSWTVDLLSNLVAQIGGADVFDAKIRAGQGMNEVSGYYRGLATDDEYLSFFDNNREALIKMGRQIAAKSGKSSLLALVHDHIQHPNTDLDDIAYGLGLEQKNHRAKDSSASRVAGAGYVVTLAYDYLHTQFVSFISEQNLV